MRNRTNEETRVRNYTKIKETKRRYKFMLACFSFVFHKYCLHVLHFYLNFSQPNHTILALLRRFQPFINPSGATYYMNFGKTRMFGFREIGIAWSLLRVNFPNLRFEDFHFFGIFVNILRMKKSSAENFFVRPRIFFIRKFLRRFWIFFRNFLCSAEDFFIRY